RDGPRAALCGDLGDGLGGGGHGVLLARVRWDEVELQPPGQLAVTAGETDLDPGGTADDVRLGAAHAALHDGVRLEVGPRRPPVVGADPQGDVLVGGVTALPGDGGDVEL